MATIIFLGTGGGRFSTVYQVRRTGGIYLKDGANIHIDPGPGAVLAMREMHLDPAKTDCILVSHAHPDHYGDAEVLIEGMTRCSFTKRGLVAGSRSAIDGHEGFGPAISGYHRGIAGESRALVPGDELAVKRTKIAVTPTRHSDPDGVGFVIRTSSGAISYVSDSELVDEVVNSHKGARALIMCVTRPRRSRVRHHLSSEDGAAFAKEIDPEIAIITHFGSKMVHEGIEKERRFIEEESGVRTVAAEDFMRVSLGKAIRVTRHLSQKA
ncbi:MAG TPA: MBL fold metallo-hydrolase [Methanomassiliicoccales archaeon]|nr:MBL fold metallo-hydrolase [Methanomassiliicoccales archaeon]